MDPQTMMMMAMMGQQGGQQANPLTRAFSAPPMFGGTPIMPSQMFDMSGIPGFGGGTMGMLTGMLMQGILPGLMGPNFMPGQFAPTQNIFDHKYAVDHFMQRRKAIEMGSQADAETYFRMIRGMARMSGIEYSPGGMQEQSARRFAQDLTMLGPIVGDMMPELFDQIHGIRGSASMMARNMFEGSRYTFDPSSGRLGMSGANAGDMTRQVFDLLYGEGRDLTQMRGIGAGRAGQVYDEMMRRGLGPSVLSDSQMRAGLEQELGRPLRDIQSPELQQLKREIDAGLKSLDTLDPQAFDAASRSFNATRVAESLKNMSGAVAAMKDIFGDMGRPNAPMVELINGLNVLTQGGLATMNPADVEASVRRTYAMAKYTGLGLEGMLGFAGSAGQLLDTMGMNRALAPDIAYSSAGFAFGYGLSGQPRNIGGLDKEMASQLDIRLRVNAAKSSQAARLATVARFSDEFQRMDGGVQVTGFAANSEAFALAEAIKSGQQTYSFGGRQYDVMQSIPRISQILRDAGVNENEVASSLLADPNTQADIIKKYGIQDTVREGQGRADIERIYSNFLASSFSSSLSSTGVPENQRKDLALSLGRAMAQEAQSLIAEDPGLFDNGREVDRNAAIAKRLRARLGDQLNGVSDAELENMIGAGFRRADQATMRKGSGLNSYKSFVGALQVNNRRSFELSRRTRGEIEGITRLQSALSGIGQEGLVARISDYLQDNKDGGSIKDLVFNALGGVASEKVAEPLAALLSEISELQGEYEKAGSIRNPEERRIAQERILEDIRKLGPDVSRLMEGDMTKLSPQAQSIVQRFKDRESARGGGTDTSKLTPEQQKIMDARNALRDARDKVLEGQAPVAAAKRDRDAAAASLADIQAKISGSTNTTEVSAARDKLKGLFNSRRDIEAALATETDPEKIKELRERLSAVRREELDASDSFTKEIRTAEGRPEVRALRDQERKARELLESKQRVLSEAIEKAGPDADKDPTVAAKRAELEALMKAPAASKDVGFGGRMSSQNVALTTNTTNVKDSRVEIVDAKEIKLNAQNVTLTASETGRYNPKEETTGDPAGTGGQRLVGVLKLEGLDRVLIDATGVPTDPRSLT